MNNVINPPRKSKIFGRPVPVRPLDDGKIQVEGVVYERWELAACKGMSEADLVRYHNNKVARRVDHALLCGHAAEIKQVTDAVDGEVLNEAQAEFYQNRLRKISCARLLSRN